MALHSPRIIVSICTIICCVLAKPCAWGQETLHFDSYGVDDGLPQSTIWGIAQDKNGFLWISTSDGVCKFDGYEFTPCDNIPGGRKSITGFVYPDSRGNIWFKHYFGLSKYDVSKNNVCTIYRYKKRFSYDLLLGEDSKGFMWAVMVEAGLLKIDNTTNKITQTIALNDSFVNKQSRVNFGFVDNKDRIWMSQSTKGLVCYNIRSGTFSVCMDTVTTLSVIPVNDSILLIGGIGMLYLLNTRNLKASPINQDLWPEDMRLTVPIVFAAKGLHDDVWLGTSRGIYIFDPQTLKVIRHIGSFSDDVRNYSNVQAAFRDQSGNMWIGTDGDGLKKLANNTKKFRSYPHRTEGGNMVKAISADSRNVYVGYFENGIDIFGRKERTVQHIDKAKIPGHSVYAIIDVDSVHKLLLLDQERIGIFNCSTNTIADLHKTMSRDIPGEIKNKENHSFLIRSKKHLAYFGRDDKLARIDGSDVNHLKFGIVHTFTDELVRCAYITSAGTLFVGTTSDFYFQDNEAGTWIKGNLPVRTWVKNITEDISGNIWIGTIDGIYVYGPRQKMLYIFNEKNLLKNNFIYEMACDHSGNMWISHNKGLSVYSASSKTFHHYSKEDGLPSNEFNTGAFCRTVDGEFFFGGINGITSFYPDEIVNNPVLPQVQITKITLLDEPLKSDSGYWQLRLLTLPYNKNILGFEFSALEFTNSSKNQYAYMMEGIDPGWIQSGNKRFARYANIPPGHYTFKVKGSNNDGIWSLAKKNIYITITPPYWQQAWFVALYLLAGISFVAGLAWLLQRQRFKRKLQAIELQRKIQDERERISRDLHDSVGTQLSLISNNIEWVAYPLKEFSEEERTEKLKYLNQKSRDVVATLRESIWALNKEAISIEDFSDKLKSFIQKQLVLYTHITLRYKETIDQNIVFSPNEALNLFRICQEGIANSLKYADASNLEVTIDAKGKSYKIQIADNGKGFEPGDKDVLHGHGLENMQHRADEIYTKLEIISAKGSGTRIIISNN